MPGLLHVPKLEADADADALGGVAVLAIAASGVDVEGDPNIVVEGSIVKGKATRTVFPLPSVIGMTTVVATVARLFAR